MAELNERPCLETREWNASDRWRNAHGRARPVARGVGEMKAFGPEAFREMCSNKNVSSSTVDVLPLFCKMQQFWVTRTCGPVVTT